MSKVYCNDCRHFSWGYEYTGPGCSKVITKRDTPTHRVEVCIDYKKTNIRNSCKFYEPKLWERIMNRLSGVINGQSDLKTSNQ